MGNAWVFLLRIDYGKILKDWQQMPEDEKRRFIYFTYILCDYFGGDINWCDFDGMLSDNEKKFVINIKKKSKNIL